METGCQGGQGSPRAVAPGWMDGSHGRHEFREKVIEHKMYSDFVYNFFSEAFLMLRRTEREIINVHRALCKLPVILYLSFRASQVYNI